MSVCLSVCLSVCSNSEDLSGVQQPAGAAGWDRGLHHPGGALSQQQRQAVLLPRVGRTPQVAALPCPAVCMYVYMYVWTVSGLTAGCWRSCLSANAPHWSSCPARVGRHPSPPLVPLLMYVCGSCEHVVSARAGFASGEEASLQDHPRDGSMLTTSTARCSTYCDCLVVTNSSAHVFYMHTSLLLCTYIHIHRIHSSMYIYSTYVRTTMHC